MYAVEVKQLGSVIKHGQCMLHEGMSLVMHRPWLLKEDYMGQLGSMSRCCPGVHGDLQQWALYKRIHPMHSLTALLAFSSCERAASLNDYECHTVLRSNLAAWAGILGAAYAPPSSACGVCH